jgi:hypothetical protein
MLGGGLAPPLAAASGPRLPIGGHGGCRGARGEQGRDAEIFSGATLPTQHQPALVGQGG